MTFASFGFVTFALLAVALLRLSPSVRARHVVLCAANLVFFASFVSEPRQVAPLLCFLAVGYVAILVAARHTGAGLGLLIAGIVAGFVWLKQYAIASVLPGLGFVYLTVGLSYILFRILHLMIDVAQGAARPPGILSYINYTLFFLTFVSGPIQRYQDFSDQMQSPPIGPTSAVMDRGLMRAVAGYLLLLLLANMILRQVPFFQSGLYAHFARHEWLLATADLAAAAWLYFIYLYVNFSGYMHIVVGIGALAGFRLPENFNQPLRAANFLDFWSRWHLTLSEWFKFYLFNPLLKVLGQRWGATVPVTYLGAVAFFVTFCMMGVWHGTTAIFLIYGVLLGLGVTVNKLWQAAAAKRLGRDGYRALCRRAWYAHGARAAGLAYFCVALTCLWVDPTWSPVLVTPAGIACGLGAFMVLTAAGTACVYAEGRLIGYGQRLAEAVATRLPSETRPLHPAWAAAIVFLMVLFAVVKNGFTPEFVYKGF